MRGVNKVIIVGNLGQDPETRTFPDGGSLTNISVATSESWKDKTTGEQVERTEWHRVQFNGRLAEVAAQYLKKGSKVYIEGSLRTRKWQDKQTGADRYSTDITARTMQMLDGKDQNLSTPQNAANTSNPSTHGASSQGDNYSKDQKEAAKKQANSMPMSDFPADSFDDDIPF